MEDLRPRPSWRLRGRRVRHWTPPYLFYRVRSILTRRWHPDHPSITAAAVRWLDGFLKPTFRGVEFGSGNSTRWFASRTAHLTSFETGAEYFSRVRAALEAERLTNVDYRLIPFQDADEGTMHRAEWVRAASAFADRSLDYALVDSSPRGCLCAALVSKLKPGGVLVLDDAHYYIPPPASVSPRVPGTVSVALGQPGSRAPDHVCWPRVVSEISGWRQVWTSDGIQMTLMAIKPD